MNHKKSTSVAAALTVVLLLAGCVSDTPTTPDQFPPPPTNTVSGIMRTGWILSSRPATVADSLQFGRGRLAWYNPLDLCLESEVWDTYEKAPGESPYIPTLTLEYRPNDFIPVYDTINDIIDSLTRSIPPELSWNGITAYLPRATAEAFADAAYLDIRLRGDEGIMHIDLGRISEDIDGDGRLDNEDINLNRILDEGEDVGLDMLPDILEFGYDPAHGVVDPAGDNWNGGDIWRINGTEGNLEDYDNQYAVDTEDRNYNGLEKENDYFSYRVDLSDNSSHYVPQSRNEYGWKTIRLPVGESGVSDAIVGNPAWGKVPYIRIWFDSVPASFMDNSLTVELAGLNLDVVFDTVTHPPTVVTNIFKDMDYKKRTVYDLGRLPLYRSRTDTFPEPDKYDFMHGDSVVKLILFRDNMNTNDSTRLLRPQGLCYIDPEDTLSDDTLGLYRTLGYFETVESTDFCVYRTHFYVLFMRAILDGNDVLAAYMEVRRHNGSVDTIGDISSQPYRLKLIKPEQYLNFNHHVWEYEWKNVYWMGSWHLNLPKIDVRIYKGSPIDNHTFNPDDLDNQDGIPYLQILGLDSGDNNSFGEPDGEIDRVRWIDAALGLLYFPSRHPFDSYTSLWYDDTTLDSIYLRDSVPEIYLDITPSEQASKYYIMINLLEENKKR